MDCLCSGGKNTQGTQLIIRRIVKDVDGNLEATLLISAEQAAFLINMGLVTLVQAGTVKVQDMTEDEFKKEVQEQKAEALGGQGNSKVTTPQPASSDEQLEFLQSVDPSKLHKA
jgi:hypothetical protein